MNHWWCLSMEAVNAWVLPCAAADHDHCILLPLPLEMICDQCDQTLERKSCPTVSKSCLNNIHSSFTQIDLFENGPKVTNLFWATFVSKFVAKNFEKSPNLVALFVKKDWVRCENISIRNLILFSYQSYKHFTIVNYNSRVIIWANL